MKTDTRKVKVLSLPETIKEKSTFRAKAVRLELVVNEDYKSVCCVHAAIFLATCHAILTYNLKCIV